MIFFYYFQDSVSLRSPSSNREIITKRLSGNTEFIVNRFIEKVNENTGNVISPNSSMYDRSHSSYSGDRRRSSHSSETHSDYLENSYQDSGDGSGSKVTNRWQHNVQDTVGSSQKSPHRTSVTHSGGSSFDNSFADSRGSSYDVSFF